MGPADLDRLCPDWRKRETYISGPNEMLEAFRDHFDREGDCDRLHMERFQPKLGLGQAGGGEGGTSKFLMSSHGGILRPASSGHGAGSGAKRPGPAGTCCATCSGAARPEPFLRTLTADVVANIIRNVWAYAIIFCGPFPDQTYTFTEEEVKDETRGGWYVRQLTGAANIDGGPMFHVMSGNHGYQVEHHLYPDMPSTRYGEIAPKVPEICVRYGLPYNSGPFRKQLGMV